ncbi:hypothetical protein [Rothia sp. P5766]|uniref:hypothetical protein n=1 Tax=Rothia sp. P5766 TaxID=3402656 RepID=UPI003AE33F93
MATSFGIGPDGQGNGTTPEDIQIITAAEYANPGILAGCEVDSTTGMSYHIKAGAVVIALASDRYVKAPVSPQTIPTEPAPAIGSRTDVVYVKQNLGGSDGNNAVIVGVSSSVPANAVEIARYTVNAGTTGTNQAERTGDTKYARPRGASLGTLYGFVDTDTSVKAEGVFKRGAGSFYLPTDRNIEISLQSCVSTELAADINGDQRPGGSVMYKIYVDGVLKRSFERGFSNIWDVRHFEFGMDLNAGRHTVHYTVERRWVQAGSTGRWRVQHGHADKFPGDIFHVGDRGVALV